MFSGAWLALAALVLPSNAAQPAPVPAPPPPASEPEGDGAIVPDAKFDQALPPIADDLNAPLESIAPLEPVPPAIGPALAEPLPPLASFDATPPAEVADVEQADAPEIKYDVAINGLEEVGLEDQFKSLSALTTGSGKAANAAVVAARGREDEALAVRLMKSLGYYDGTASATIEQKQGGGVRAVVTAFPGRQYKLGSVKVAAQQTVPVGLVARELPLKVGDPIEAIRVQGAEANVSLKLPQQGYPFVTVGERDILLDEAVWTGAYTLPVDTGPRASFGVITTQTAAPSGTDKTGVTPADEVRPVFDLEHLNVFPRFKTGEIYDVRKTDDMRDALVATGLFSTVSVEPVRTGRPGPEGTEAVDLLVRQTAGKARSLTASAGYSTGQGFRLEGGFTHRNLFPPEGALIVTGVGGTQEQGLGITFRRSNAGKRDRTVSLTASANHSNYDAFDAFTGTIAGRISYNSTPIWQKKFTYAFGFELTGTNESVYDFTTFDRERRTYAIGALPVQVLFDTSNDLLNPTRGFRLKLNVSPEGSVQGGFSPYVRTLVEGTAYYPVSDALVIAGRARAGSIQGIARDDLAPSRRYYGGGGGSVRGYGYQRLGPFDPNGDPVGGRSLAEFSLEARYRFGDFGIVPFIDAGNSYKSTTPTFSSIKLGAGIGGRFYTNFGPLRVDVATPLNRRKGDGRIALYISIGQAF